MAEQDSENKTNQGGESSAGGRSKDEVALELMKFIAVTTGYGKAPQASAVSWLSRRRRISVGRYH